MASTGHSSNLMLSTMMHVSSPKFPSLGAPGQIRAGEHHPCHRPNTMSKSSPPARNAVHGLDEPMNTNEFFCLDIWETLIRIQQAAVKRAQNLLERHLLQFMLRRGAASQASSQCGENGPAENERGKCCPCSLWNAVVSATTNFSCLSTATDKKQCSCLVRVTYVYQHLRTKTEAYKVLETTAYSCWTSENLLLW